MRVKSTARRAECAELRGKALATIREYRNWRTKRRAEIARASQLLMEDDFYRQQARELWRLYRTIQADDFLSRP